MTWFDSNLKMYPDLDSDEVIAGLRQQLQAYRDSAAKCAARHAEDADYIAHLEAERDQARADARMLAGMVEFCDEEDVESCAVMERAEKYPVKP